MPVRLTKPAAGQAANTVYWGADEAVLLATGFADTQIELASDYASQSRTVTTAAAVTSRNASVYIMNSGSTQTLTVEASGYLPVNSVITVIQAGAGATTIVGATGVTVTAGNGLTSLVTKGQNYVAQLIKTGASTWVAIGGLGG